MNLIGHGAATAAALLLCATGPARADEGEQAMDHSRHQGHAGHPMTAEQVATLKRKVPLYAGFTDEQINENMSRMTPDTEAYLSAASVRDEIGVLGLGHGYAGNGNEQFKAGYVGVARLHPTAVGLGMSMMGSSHVQEAVDQIEAAGAKTIVVLPSETSETSSLVRQWHYMFGLTNESGYLDVPRIRTTAKIVMARSPTRSPIIGQILGENLKAASRAPAKEAALLIMHGPENPAENEDELRNLAKLAAIVKDLTGIPEVSYGSLQDDAPPAIRAANVQRMRDWIAKAQASGKIVLVEPVLLTAGGRVSQKLGKDLDGLTYTFVDTGMIGHPLFAKWVQDTVAGAPASASGPSAPATASPGDNINDLTPDQRVAAESMLVFMDEVEKEFFALVKELNRSDTIYQQLVDPGNAHYEIRSTRGKVLERAAVMTAITQAEKPPFVKGGKWNRFFEVAVHPKTPKVGMLHATLVVQVGADGSSTIAGTIDMMKAAQPEEDLTWFRARRDEVFTHHGVDPSKYVVGGCGKPNEGGWKWHRPSTCTGASIFGANLDASQKNFEFVSDVFRTGMQNYFALVKKRYRERYTEVDVQAQDFMRRRWLEDQLFWDVLSRNFVPYEAWAAVNAPPVVKF